MAKDAKRYYTNDVGTFYLKKGKLYQGNKRFNSKEVRAEGGPLKLSDKDGKPIRTR